MSKLHYIGPRVEISNHGIYYKHTKEDKYIYLTTALEILKDLDNNYEKNNFYSHHYENKKLNEEDLFKVLGSYEKDIETCITNEIDKYKNKIQEKITCIQNSPYLTDIDKEVWIKNIYIMKEYKIKRAINKMYYMHCIQDIIKVIRHKKIKDVIVPLNKNFFHVLNTLKGTMITGKPSLDTKVTEEYDQEQNMILKLSIR